jgi:phosphatidate cytidylyltransferase
MKRVLTAVVLIPLVLVAVFRAPIWLLSGLVAVVALLALHEYLTIADAHGYKTFRPLTMMLAILMYGMVVWAATTPALSAWEVLVAFVFYFALAPFVYLCAGMMRQDLRTVLPGAAMSYIGLPYVVFSLACVIFLRMVAGGWFFLLFTFCCVWIGDTAAYYAGRAFGHLKFSPRISPKKTWEGAIASVLASIIIGIVLVHFAPEINSGLVAIKLLTAREIFVDTPLWIPAIIALVINVAAQLGDLFESLIKRGAAIKDSGTLLPGHGGVLDRIDALLFAAPVALIIFGGFVDKFLQMP